MTLFEECDKAVFRRRLCERNSREWCIDPSDTEEETAYIYRLPALHARQRLDILGYTVAKARALFDTRVAEYAQEVSQGGIVSGLWWLPDGGVADFLRNYSFCDWSQALRTVLDPSFERARDRVEQQLLPPVLRLVSADDGDDFFYGFPSCDPRLFIRCVLEECSTSAPVILDFTELVNAGYYTGGEALASQAKSAISTEFLSTGRIVILTEGSTDARYLRESLSILYPHLSPLFTFLDFDVPNMEGGAPNLVRILKGLVGAQIAHRVVALFDNDTAASDALRALQGTPLPANYRVCRFPDLPYAEQYPTIGPQGAVPVDVNGLAGSIELYFGRDTLCDEAGLLTPVRWRGFSAALGQYQGELTNKQSLQRAFDKKVSDAKNCQELPGYQDWSGMRSIWERVFEVCREISHEPQSPAVGPGTVGAEPGQ